MVLRQKLLSFHLQPIFRPKQTTRAFCGTIGEKYSLSGSNMADYNVRNDERIFPNYGPGPLESYRKTATFDWKELKLIWKNEEALKFQYDVWEMLEKTPIFSHPEKPLSMDEYRHLTVKRLFTFFRNKFYDLDTFLTRSDLEQAVSEAMLSYDPSLCVKLSLGYGMFPSVLRSLGTERLGKYVEANFKGEIGGAFALTEFSHGTNAKNMRTTASFDKNSSTFILNTPDFEASKCWVGNLGKTCTHAIVYAQLIDGGGKNHGLNAFLVPIRDPKTLKAFPGVIVGDLGEKIGLVAVDNGFVMFTNYHIPRENLLARTGDVNEAGEFVTPFKDKTKRLGASLGALSGGRVGICNIAVIYLIKAVSIAVRYSASRRQFGPDESETEWPVIEYQSQQYRLFPFLSAGFAIRMFSIWLSVIYKEILIKGIMGEDVASAGMELHALSSAAKPVCAWTARDGIQECREACGGHGYLKISQIGNLRNDNDANCTYEGENNVLIQQASNWLLNVRKKGYAAFKDASPLGSAAFLADYDRLIKQKANFNSIQDVINPENILLTLNWLTAYQLEKTWNKVQSLAGQKKTPFEIRNDSQTFYAGLLSIIYGQRMVFERFYNTVKSLNGKPNEQRVLMDQVSMFGLYIVNKHQGILFEGEFIRGPKAAELYSEAVLSLLPKIKLEAMRLIDVIAPPDFILNSPLGMSDGNVYKHLQTTIMSAPEALQRPSWWKDVVHWDQSKL